MIPVRAIAGRALYRCFYEPLGHVQALLRAGGPWEKRRTERGRAEMEAAAATLPLPVTQGEFLEVHVLTGKNFWYQTAFCLYSYSHYTRRPLRPVLYDDGSLDDVSRRKLERLFPEVRRVSFGAALEKLETQLPRSRFPHLRERWDHYPNIRKLIDPHLGSRGWKLVMDSDLLFFREPEFLLSWQDTSEHPLHGVDAETSYGYSRPLLEELSGRPLAEKLNVGLCGLRSETLDFDRLEFLCRRLIEQEGTHYYLEQALVAILLAGQPCAVAPAADYLTLPTPPEASECRAVMHHYVANSKRWYFQRNWRRIHNPETTAA